MMQHWADCVADVTTFDLFPTNPHAMLERLKVDPGDFFCMHIITIAIQHLDTLLPDGYPPLSLDKYEFWTCMEWLLSDHVH